MMSAVAPPDLWTLTAALYMAGVLAVAVTCDLRRLVIPNACNAASFAGAVAFTSLEAPSALAAGLAGGLIGSASLLALHLGFRVLRGQDGLGLGDVKYMAGAGVWVGWQGLAPLLLVASLSALLFVAGRQALVGGFDRHMRLPFAPFLALGTMSVWLLQASGSAPWLSPPEG